MGHLFWGKRGLTKASIFFLLFMIGHCDALMPPPPPIPTTFQDLYTSLNGYLSAFNTTLGSVWNGSKYPVLFGAHLAAANGNNGPTLINSTTYQLQLQALQAMGVKAVLVRVGFPILYQPFYTYLSTVPGYQTLTYDQFASYYQQVAQAVRAAGLKLLVEDDVLLANDVQAVWGPVTGPYYATLNWTQFQAARAQCALAVAQIMQPDYLVVLEEPETEAYQTGQSQVNTASGATSLVSAILTSVGQSGVPGLKVGAGVSDYQPSFQQFIQNFVTLPLDFIDMHIYPVNNLGPPSNTDFLANALTIASMAKAAGKPITITEAWMWKMRNSEWGVMSADDIRARGAFSFWEPLDAYFLQTLENLANYEQMPFMSPSTDDYPWAYLTYDSSTQNLTDAEIFSQQGTMTSQANRNATYTSTAISYYHSLVSPPDTTPPSTPANLTGVSGDPASTFLTWNASTDNVGVAGYYVFRNGVNIATTALTQYGDSGLTGATTYSYTVEAFDLGGNDSAPTLPISVMTRDVTPPTAPTNVVATAISAMKVTLTWSASTDNVAVGNYRIFRGTSPSALSQVATRASTPTSYTDINVTGSTTYYYGVEAVDTSGNVSPMSAVVSATTPP
jgi:chitodextrinase